jgi:hypothetical protein
MHDDDVTRDLQSLQVDEDPNPAFADALFDNLEQVAADRPRGTRRWMLLAVALLSIGVGASVAVGSGALRAPWLVVGPGVTYEPQPSATLLPTVTPESSLATVSPTPSVAPTPSAAAGIGEDDLVRIVVADLTLRDAPGLDGTRIGELAGDGTLAFVVAGPVSADGYGWFELSALGIPPQSGCAVPPPDALDECPNWFGWVAGRGPDGEMWLEPASLDCAPSPMNMSDLISPNRHEAPGGNVTRLACYGDRPITVRGWWPELQDGLGGACAAEVFASAWLYCENTNHNEVWEESRIAGLHVFINPASGVSMPARGQWVEIVGHFDDAAAEGCAEAAEEFERDANPDEVVLRCRARLVADSVKAVDGPF